jgi:hypothetical protein
VGGSIAALSVRYCHERLNGSASLELETVVPSIKGAACSVLAAAFFSEELSCCRQPEAMLRESGAINRMTIAIACFSIKIAQAF